MIKYFFSSCNIIVMKQSILYEDFRMFLGCLLLVIRKGQSHQDLAFPENQMKVLVLNGNPLIVA